MKWFEQNNCCHRLCKVAQWAENRPIMSHCFCSTLPLPTFCWRRYSSLENNWWEDLTWTDIFAEKQLLVLHFKSQQWMGAWIAEWYHTWLWTLVHFTTPWAVSLHTLVTANSLLYPSTTSTLFHDSIWFIWFNLSVKFVTCIVKQKIENKLNLFFKQKVPVIETIIILKRRFKQKIENTEEKQFIFGVSTAKSKMTT